MKIAIICNDSFGIINYRLNLANALKEAGHHVILISPQDEYYQTLQAYGFEQHSFKLARLSTNLFTELRAIFSLFFLLLKLKPAITLSFTIKANLYGGLCSRLLSIPNVPNITGMGTGLSKKGIKSSLIKWLYQIALGNSKLVFCQNPDDKQQLLHDKLLKQSTPIQLLPGSGVDLSQFTYSPPSCSLPKRYIFVARILEEKGILHFCEAAQILHSTEREFIVLGRGDEREASTLASLQKSHEQNFVNYKGLVDNVSEEVSAAFASVLPSWYREGTPRSLLESLAVGTPIITTNNIGCKEALFEHKNGLACEEKNTQSLIDTILALESLSEAEYHAMCRQARDIAETTFDEKIVLQHYLNVVSA